VEVEAARDGKTDQTYYGISLCVQRIGAGKREAWD
jgi:hypothetical protein